MRRLAVSILAVLAVGLPAQADARSWRLTSPGGQVTVGVHGAGGAPLSATVRHAGTRVLDLRIGLRAGGRCLPQGLRYRGAARARVDERYTTPAGKRRDHRYVARRLVLAFRTGRTRAEVRLQASDDGVAWRTTVHGADVTAECSTAAAPAGARAWLQRYGTSYERPYEESALRAAAPGAIGFPALIGAGDHWALLAESGLGAGQPAARLRIRRGAPGVLRVERPVQRQATPWRVAVVGSPATIAGSDLVDDLAAPAAGVDWSWVRPGRVAWSWWADSGSPASLAAQEAHVDFAARQGWEYVLADEGWDPAWMPALVEYARARGVGVLLWSRWDALRTPAQREALLSQWADWGVAGVKLDFMESDSPARMAWYRAVARAAAERRMVVDFHGSTAPRGLERTWPNVLTSEAVRGAEGYKGTTPPTPAQNTVLPFTRNAIGAMDFTPVTFSAPGRATSAGHELALSVVFASGLQHFADSPAAYAARPLAAGWLAERPRGVGRHAADRGPAGGRRDARAPVGRPLVRRLDPRRRGRDAAGPARLPRPRPGVRGRDRGRRRRRRPGGQQPGGHRGEHARRPVRARRRLRRADPAGLDRHGELAPGDVEHDRLALAGRDRERHVRVARRERRGRHRAAAERAGEREDRVGEQLDAPDRRGQLARLGIGAQRGRGHRAQVAERDRQRRGIARDTDRVGILRHLQRAVLEPLEQHGRRGVAAVEQGDDAFGSGTVGEVVDGGERDAELRHWVQSVRAAAALCNWVGPPHP